MYAELEGDVDGYPLTAAEYYEKVTGKTLAELVIERGYTWYQYSIKKNYYF